MATEYKKVAIKRFPRLLQRETAENRYWKSFQFPVVIKEFAAVTSVSFNPEAPFDVAACSSTRIQVYNTSTNKVSKSISRFKGIVHGCHFRNDGKLLLAGDETGLIQMFDVNGRAVLRSFEGHTRGVHIAKFMPGNASFFSGADDSTVRLWDIPTAQEIHSFADHKDYVRAGVPSSSNANLFLTGSYDHTVRLWDVRSKACAITADHGAPVEAVLMFPSGTSFISAGGNQIKLWDALTGKLLAAFSNHQKTVTSLCFDSQHKRLLAGGLDCQAKIYDLSTCKVVHSIKYPAPILSIAVSPNDSHLVVGMASGLLSIKHRERGGAHVVRPTRPARAGSYRYFVRGQDSKASSSDVVVDVARKPRLMPYDVLLKKFKTAEALDAALKTERPTVIISFIQELVLRSVLVAALRGRNDRSLQPILAFVAKHISNPRYSALLIDVAHTLLDLYAPGLGQSPVIDEMFLGLSRRLEAEISFQRQLLELAGALDMIMATGSRSL